MRAHALALLLCAAGCGGGTDLLGLHAWLRLPGATYISGPLPEPSGGPQVFSASASRTDISPGLQDRTVQASVGPDTSGVALGLKGDSGYWIVPAGPPDVQEPNALTLAAPLVFAPFLPPGTFELIVRPLSANGRAGIGATIELHNQVVQDAPAALEITLSWDTEADLDLHVVDPKGSELYWGHITTQDGVLDFDSNQSCLIDGRRRESALWATSAPAGHYLVRIDTPSLCGAPTAHWQVEARRGGQIVGRARGQAIASDTRGAHAKGAGVLALELDMP